MVLNLDELMKNSFNTSFVFFYKPYIPTFLSIQVPIMVLEYKDRVCGKIKLMDFDGN